MPETDHSENNYDLVHSTVLYLNDWKNESMHGSPVTTSIYRVGKKINGFKSLQLLHIHGPHNVALPACSLLLSVGKVLSLLVWCGN